MAVSKLSAKQPWTAVWTPGVNLVNFYNLYDSRGDVTISVATSIPTTLDGPIQVVRYGALTVNAPMTAAQRCRGFMPLCDSLSVGAAGSISMTARGAAGAANWAVDKDIFVPQAITFTGKHTSYADFLAWIRKTGYCIFDPSMYASPPPGMGDVTCDWATWVPYGSTIISTAGCGAGASPVGNSTGNTGGTGTGGPGGGGGGPAPYMWGAGSPGAPGRVWGGGQGSGGGSNTLMDIWGRQGGSANCGGGGAGNPGGPSGGAAGGTAGASGTGGVVIIICRGSVTLTAGHSFSSNGSAGGAGYGGRDVPACGGGGSGGGFIGLYYGATLTGTVSYAANGGAGGTASGANNNASNYNGGPGGAGVMQTKAFSTMGWAV